MNSKEKAKEITEMFYDYANDIDGSNIDFRKQCALICVDEIIKEVERIEEEQSYGFSSDYWKEVKQEITKI